MYKIVRQVSKNWPICWGELQADKKVLQIIKKLKLKLFTMIGLLLTVVALTEVNTNSIRFLYEPEIPKCLKNKD